MKKLFICVSIYWCSIGAAQSTTHELLISSTPWIREYITSTVTGLAHAHEMSKRYQMNQQAIGASLRPYFGKQVSDKITQLLVKQSQLTLDIIDATEKNDVPIRESAIKQWKFNASEISALLSKNNPYLDYTKLRALFYDYLTFLHTMVQSRAMGKWAEDAATYEALQKQSYSIAQTIQQALDCAYPSSDKEKSCTPSAKAQRPSFLPPGTSLVARK